MIATQQLEAITDTVKAQSAVMAAYVFGSRARGDSGPMSDYDIAVHVEGLDALAQFDLRLQLIGNLTRVLQTDEVDVVLLNQTDKPALKYYIIRDGQLLFDRDDYRLRIEPRILNEYFDFQIMLKRNGLTKAEA